MKNEIKASNDNQISSNDFFVIDMDLLPLVEKAEGGCLDAQQELYFAFSGTRETKAKENYEMANHYLDLAYKVLSQYDELGNKLAKYDILWNKVLLEEKFKTKASMQKAFYEMLDYMREHIPLKEWDYRLFEIFGDLIKAKEN